VGIPSPPAILLPSGDIVTPEIRDAERMQGFPAGWTEPAEREKRKSYRWTLVGNAVTVQVAEWLGKRFAAPGEWIEPALAMALKRGGTWPRAAYNVGNGRFAAEISAWPVHRPGVPLRDFLRFPTLPLSAKATAGFYGRTRTSSLRFPDGFLDAVAGHLDRMTNAARAV
jgi:DNA (cytosine-5)-methyltransferase 1